MIPVIVAVMASSAVRAANVTKADNTQTLDLGGSWIGNAAPTATDIAAWDNTVATAANCTNTLAASASWDGIEILNPAAPVQINNSGGAVLTLGSSGIDLNEAGTSQSLFLNFPVFTVSDQNWTIKSGQQLTFGNSATSITNGNTVTADGQIVCNNGFNIKGNGTLIVNSGAFTMSTTSGNALNVGSDVNGGTITQNGGTVSVSKTGGTSGSYTPSLVLGGAANSTGIYNLNSGSLTDITANTFAYCVPGNASGATGILNISGGSADFYSLRLGNSGGTGIVNMTNGTLTVVQGEFSIGRGSGGGPGTVNVYGGLISTPGISVNVAKGGGAGTLNMNGGTFSIGKSLLVPASSGSGTVNMNGGFLDITNNLNLPGGGAGNGTVNLNGGIIYVSSIAPTSGGSSTLELNGGILKARGNNTSFISTNSLLTVHVDAGGAVIDTTNFDITIPASLQSNAGPDGGLTKLGTGALTLTAPNAYNGPTVVGEGTLIVSTTNNNSFGAITVSDAATLDTAIVAAGTSLNAAALTDGTGGSDSVTNQFDLGDLGNPTAPVINATSLTANGTVYVVVNGSGFSLGTIPLIKYSGSVSGGGSFVLKVAAGAVGYVTNDTSAQQINLVITDFPKLTWRALVDTNWDFTTVNWVDSDDAASLYVDGATVFFNDSASNTTVNLTNSFSPAVVNFDNVNSNYVVAGSGLIGGAASLIKTSAGTVLIALTNNSYSGDTVISNGTLQLGARNVIPSGTGKGNLTLEGKLDLAGFNQSLNGLNGSSGVVDNSGGASVVLSVGNGGGNGIFSGQIKNTGADLALNVTGAGIQLLGTNTYSGGTTNSANLVLGSAQSIGSGQLTLSGGVLSWADALAHTISNQVVITGGSTLGAVGNGLLTIQNTADFAGDNRSLTCNEDVIFPNGVTNGFPGSKNGQASLTVQNTPNGVISGSVSWTGGSTIYDNCPGIVQSGGNPRIQCSTNQIARMVITNGTTFLFTNDAGGTENFLIGDNDTDGDTNELDVAGTMTMTPYPVANGNTTADAIEIGTKNSKPNTTQIVNLLSGGLLQTRYIDKVGVTALNVKSVLNFDGGTLSPNTNDFASEFIGPNIDEVNVLDGGAVIDTAGWDVTVKNDLFAAGAGIGSFTKNGAGNLILAGSGIFPSTYGGSTIVNAGTLTVQVSIPNSTNFVTGTGAILDVSSTGLTISSGRAIGGSGVVVGSITVDSGGLVNPGTATSAGTLTFSNSAPSLNGETLLKLNKGSLPSNDQVAITSGTLTYGGTLVVTNIGATPASGDKFYLFSAPSYSGSFSGVTLPALPAGLGWTNNFLGDGSITVTGAVVVVTPPRFNAVASNNGTVVFSGTNGPASGSYRVLTTTNLALPFTNWTAVATNQFDNGNFGYTNTINPTNGAQFFNISVP